MPMQTDNPFLDGLAKLVTDAAGAAEGARAEIELFVKQRIEKLIADMDLVTREEFEAVKAMAANARNHAQRLEKRLAALERRRVPKSPRIPMAPRRKRKL
jgi:BMFP domain-containing protein YqiC